MACSLWRNGELVAELAVPFPTSERGMIFGLLRIAEGFTDIREFHQQRVRIFPGAPVFIHDITDERSAPASVVTLAAISSEQANGVAAAQQFALCDDQGKLMNYDSIWIRSFEIPNGAGEFPDACRTAGLSGAGWMLIAGQSGEVPVREV